MEKLTEEQIGKLKEKSFVSSIKSALELKLDESKGLISKNWILKRMQKKGEKGEFFRDTNGTILAQISAATKERKTGKLLAWFAIAQRV